MEIDRIQFHQVISNLLGNAIKFANPKNPSIFLEAQRKNKMLVIAIEDNGPGLKDIDPANLFEKYSTGK